jgi:hypothetical protein
VKRAARLMLVAAAALLVAWFSRHLPSAKPLSQPPDSGLQASGASVAERQAAFSREDSGTQLRVTGRVERLLADDREGSPHQRFIIVTDNGISLLIAHNIALASRLDGIATGDWVEVYGEYEWNEKGGLIHWTHKDPQGNHVAGYIEWRGRRYQ